MSLRNIILAGVSVAAIATASVPAKAAAFTVSANTWYTVGFGTSIAHIGDALGGRLPPATGTHGPLIGGSYQATALVPASLDPSTPTIGGYPNYATPFSKWFINAPYGGYLLMVDTDTSGDQFTLSVSSTDGGTTALMACATPGVLGGSNCASAGMTSAPATGDSAAGTDIGLALTGARLADYSSGTFALLDGPNYISGVLAALTDNSASGDANFFIVLNDSPPPTGTPEPATLSVLGIGLAGLAALRRRRKAA